MALVAHKRRGVRMQAQTLVGGGRVSPLRERVSGCLDAHDIVAAGDGGRFRDALDIDSASACCPAGHSARHRRQLCGSGRKRVILFKFLAVLRQCAQRRNVCFRAWTASGDCFPCSCVISNTVRLLGARVRANAHVPAEAVLSSQRVLYRAACSVSFVDRLAVQPLCLLCFVHLNDERTGPTRPTVPQSF